MGILTRTFKIGQAQTNQWLDKLENPEKMIDQAIRDRENEVADARSSIAKVIAQEKQTKAELDKALRGKENWTGKAQMALRAGREELAGQALMRAEEYEQQAASLQVQWEQEHTQSGQLKKALQAMTDDLASLKRERNILVAQTKAAAVKKDIYKAKAKVGKSSTSDLIERMRSKAQQMSYEAEAAGELNQDSAGDSLEKEFADLEQKQMSNSVAEKLAAMKANL